MILSKQAKLAALLSVATLSVPGPASAGSDEPYLSELIQTSFDFCPRLYLQANGAILSIAQNTALFSLLGTTYGGDGRTTFALPDLRGRTPISTGQGPGLSNYVQGQVGGVNAVTLISSNMPSHSHAALIKTYSGAADSAVPTNNHTSRATANDYSSVAAPAGSLAADSVTVNNTGGSQPINTTQPALVIKWCIATQGLFPSRN